MLKEKRCFYCGKLLTRKNKSIDHLTPLSRGGKDTAKNKVLSCTNCNTHKGCLVLEEFRLVLALRAGFIKKSKFKLYGELC